MATLITKNSSTASAVPAAGDLVKGELAVNVTDKKVYTKDNSAAVVKLVGSLGNQEANAVAITGGAINGTTIGATTPSTGAFTTASASGGFTGNLTGNVTGNVSGTAANVTGVVAIANGGTGLSSLGTGVQSALGQAVTGSGSFVLSTSPSLTTPNLGTPSAAVLTNATGLPLTTGVTGTLGVANGGTGITAFGTGVATALGQNVTGSGGIVLATSPSLTTPNLGTPSAATLTNATGLPISTGVSGLGTGVATALAVNTGSAGAFVVNGGALGTPSSGTVTNLTGTASININGTVGATTPTTGAFTTLSASGNITVSGGTANGVAYLNGSKVLTTGSALTFDGTTFATTGRTSSANGAWVASGAVMGWGAAGTFTNYIVGDTASNYLLFQVNSAEAMRLTSTGLGIGTSSPGSKLDVQGGSINTSSFVTITPTTTTLNAIYRATNTGGTFYAGLDNSAGGVTGTAYAAMIWHTGAYPISFGTNNTLRATLDSSGNLGLGVTPTNVVGTRKLEIGGTTNAAVVLSTNSSNAAARNWATAANFNAFGDYVFLQSNALGGDPTTAGTTRMTLDASGNLGIGTTSPASKLDVTNTAADSVLSITVAGVQRWQHRVMLATGYWQLHDPTGGNTRLTVDTSGNLGIGTSSPAYKLDVVGEVRANNLFRTTDGTNIGLFGSGVFASGVVGIGSSNSVPLVFGTGATERMRLDSAGNLGLGVTPSAWNSAYKAIQNVAGALVGITSAEQVLTNNAFVSSGGLYTYTNTAPASRYSLYNGGHIWLTAPSGTAGNAISFTQALTLHASGNLSLGTTTATGRFAVVGSAAGAGIFSVDTDATRVDIQSYNKPLAINRQGNNTVFNEGGGSVGIGGSSFGSGVLVMFIANATTVPSNNPTGGGILYVEGGALKYRGSSGTITTIANA